MAKGGGTRGGIWKPPENTLILNQGFFSHFSGIFRALFMEVAQWKMPEKCLKNLNFKKQGIFRGFSGAFQVEKGIFKSLPFVPPPFAILQAIAHWSGSQKKRASAQLQERKIISSEARDWNCISWILPGEFTLFGWGSPKANHMKASQPHFSRFRVRIFCVFAQCNLLKPLFSGKRGTFRIFRIFPVSGSNRWFRKSDRPALLWPALGDPDWPLLHIHFPRMSLLFGSTAVAWSPDSLMFSTQFEGA